MIRKLRAQVKCLYMLQRLRIALGQQYKAATSGNYEADPAPFKDLYSLLRKEESKIRREIRVLAEKFPIIQYGCMVQGCGPISLAHIVCLVRDISNFPTISKLWRFAGYGLGKYYLRDGKPISPVRGRKWFREIEGKTSKVVDAEVPSGAEIGWHRDVPLKGWVLPYCKELKVACRVLGSSLLRAKSPYVNIYEESFAEYSERGLSSSHAKNAAMRKMIKVFLQHFWIIWRKLEGLSISEPYVFEKLEGHKSYLSPEDFGWPKLGGSDESR